MTIEEVKERVAEIARLGNRDYEAAHSEEDKLHVDVLAHYAAGCTDIAFAVEALKTLELDFDRHCA